uniref:Uncharacterized protein n=1 Tax=Rhizophora mucronata TaxID=61149 RepID=A0A2P2J6M0_RHIMU
MISKKCYRRKPETREILVSRNKTATTISRHMSNKELLTITLFFIFLSDLRMSVNYADAL